MSEVRFKKLKKKSGIETFMKGKVWKEKRSDKKGVCLKFLALIG